MDVGDIVKGVSAAASIAGTVAPLVTGLKPGPKMPKIDVPAAKPTPVMPTPDDDASRASALRAIANRATAHGRQSTNLSQDTLG